MQEHMPTGKLALVENIKLKTDERAQYNGTPPKLCRILSTVWTGGRKPTDNYYIHGISLSGPKTLQA